jgi:hypothetical protein
MWNFFGFIHILFNLIRQLKGLIRPDKKKFRDKEARMPWIFSLWFLVGNEIKAAREHEPRLD